MQKRFVHSIQLNSRENIEFSFVLKIVIFPNSISFNSLKRKQFYD